jgi:signal-transduction protein with cAMP-binding, CBS, and nucleotidyltransferase domain/predicted metal-dependent phosphoesterase TrpH
VRVNLHTHTIFSDGEQTPEALAATLADAGVRFASLTDHDTLEGLTRFANALEGRGIPSLPGVEMTTRLDGRELHLVAYGFDPDHAELLATLVSIRQARSLDVHSIAGSLRKAGTRRGHAGDPPGAANAAPSGEIGTADAIALIHRAGGRAFWAHPLVHESDPERLEALIARLKAMGIDGLEAIYAQFSADERALLGQFAQRHDLLVSAGTDYHGPTGIGNQPTGIDMPRGDWQRFRTAMFAGPALSAGDPASAGPGHDVRATSGPAAPSHRFRARPFVLRIALPTLTALALFLVALWGLILPSLEQTLLDRKRELIRELTNSATSILAAYQRDEAAGRLTRADAQAAATGLIRELRYGPEGKDYFWIQDAEPRMVMHPYRPDLDGTDLGGFTDPRGVSIFVEFAELVARDGQGYVDYVWQWQDDPDRLEPKESYVKGFEPWGWIIGTGLYTDDVHQEIGRIEQNLIAAALAISVVIALLLLFVLQESFRIERRRQEVVEGLRQSTARYHALVEATTEGTLLVVDGRCKYANPTLLGMLGYTSRQLAFLELPDVLPRDANVGPWQILMSSEDVAPPLGDPREGVLLRRDGGPVECFLSVTRIEVGGQSGSILLARELASPSGAAPLRDRDRDALTHQLQSALLFLHEPLGAHAQPALVAGMETGVGRLARRMTERDVTAALVTSGAGAVVGIVTDEDLRARVLAEQLDPAEPVAGVMTAPVIRIAESAPVFEALMRMEEHGVHHVAVVDADGATTGIIDSRSMVAFSRYGPVVLLGEIARAATAEDVAQRGQRAITLAGSLIDNSTRPRLVTSMLAAIGDAVTDRLVRLAIDALGPPPVPFAFIAMGSQGRQEPTLVTDQDNGIVHAAPDSADAGLISDYFLALGSRISDGLQLAGYAYCRGNVMASSPTWCDSLPGWLDRYDAWLARADPQDVADLSVLVDARVIHGDPALLEPLRRRIHATLPASPAVLYRFARNALTFRPPMRLPGNIYVGGGAEHPGEIDLKDAMMPIVAYARVEAVRHRISVANTSERIDALAAREVIPPTSHDELERVYDLLMQLRLQTQLTAIRGGQPPSGRVQLTTLGHTQQELLRLAFGQIAAIQSRIGYEYPEGG